MDASLGISRRTLLRRGAVVGAAMVWTAPVVHSLATPAAGAGTPLGDISFVAVLVSHDFDLYRMKWEVNGTRLAAESGDFSPRDLNLGRARAFEDGPAPDTSATLEPTGAVRVTLGAGCELVDYVVQRGRCRARPSTGYQPHRAGNTVTFVPPSSAACG
ncbi:MAG: hypothetical protein ACOCUN_00480 [Jiangellaceae bacterium]